MLVFWLNFTYNVASLRLYWGNIICQFNNKATFLHALLPPQPRAFMLNILKSGQKILDLIHRTAEVLLPTVGVYGEFYEVDQATESRSRPFLNHTELSGHLEEEAWQW